jgi:protein subunit release factor B
MARAFRYEDIPADPRELLKDCDVTFARGSGPGGQHRNKTETAVRIVHRPTGVLAVASEERSQLRNRERALERLHEKLVRRLKPRKARKPTAPPPAARRRRLEEKKKTARKKELRRYREPD